MIWWIWSLPGILTSTKPLMKWYGTFQYETPLLGRLDPPIIVKTCHKQCVYVYVITWHISVAVRKTDAHSYNTSASWSSLKWFASRIRPSNFRCPGAAPGKVLDLKFSENVPHSVLGKVIKFQHRNSAVSEISSKNLRSGWKHPPPLPLIGLNCDRRHGAVENRVHTALTPPPPGGEDFFRQLLIPIFNKSRIDQDFFLVEGHRSTTTAAETCTMQC